MRTVRINLANFNIRATPRMFPVTVRHDLNRAYATRASIYTWQELSKRYMYRRQLRSIFKYKKGWQNFFGKRNAVSVFPKAGIDVYAAEAHLLTKAVPWLPQPSRYADMIYCTDVASALSYDIISVHLTNGAYAGKKRSKRQIEARKRLWDKQYARLQKIVQKSLDEGRPVVVAGDFNRINPPKLSPRQVMLATHGLMKIIAVAPYGFEIRAGLAVSLIKDLKTDHPGLQVRFRVEKLDD